MCSRRQSFALWAFLIALLLLWCRCHKPPDEATLLKGGEQGPFISSQVKPPPSDLVPLEPLAKDEERRARQRSYFDQLIAGARPDKSQLLGPASPRPVKAGIQDLRAGPIQHLLLRLTRGQSVTLQTRELTPGSDTVLHLWSRAEQRQVAFDDDGGDEPGASRLAFTAGQPGFYVALLRAYSGEDDGRCQLLRDGKAVHAGPVSFGGTGVLVSRHHTLHTVLLNDRAGDEPWPPTPRAATDSLLLLLDPDSGAVLALDDDSGVELGSRIAVGEREALAVVGAFSAGADGGTRLVVNDAGEGDADGDGLGDGLERALCTCAGVEGEASCGFDCGGALTSQDTDGDGLGDAAEVLGVEHPLFPQLLVRWGADPRHKDLFVEIDLAAWEDREEIPPETHTGRSPTVEEAHAAARVFARLTEMRNPDGADGIRLHLDVGHACGAQPLGIDQVCGGLCAWGQDGQRRCGQSTHPGPPTPRLDGLAPGRRHLFHVAISDCLVAGRAPGGPADHLEYDCDRVTAMVHELGHNLGLSRHYGTVQTGGGNCKPNYPSLMNYAYSDRFNGNRDVRFSDGSLVGVGDLNPLDLDETKPFGGSGVDVGWLAARPFYYDLHDCTSPGRGCKVDFNRDGHLDLSVRAYLSPMPNYGHICENVHGNTEDVEDLEGVEASAGPAAAEVLRRSNEGTLSRALHVIVPTRTPRGTGLMVGHTFATTGGWQGWQEVPGPVLRADTQPAAAVVSHGSGDQLLILACKGGAAPVVEARLDAEGKLSALQEVPGQPAKLRARDVSVTRLGADLLLLVRDDSPDGGDQVYLTRHTPVGWSGSFIPVMVMPGPMPLRSTVTPGVAVGPNGRVYLVTGDPAPSPGTGPTGRLHLYSSAAAEMKAEDEELSGLTFEDGTPGHEHVPWSRPAMAFVPHLDGKGQPLPGQRGYLAIWWSRGTRVRYLWSWGQLDQQKASFTLGRWHHYEARGYTDALAGSSPALVVRHSGIGGARLSALIAQSDFTPYKVRHVPYADGLPERPVIYRDHDDRPVIRDNLCTSLNWDCRDRCARLTDPCAKEQRGKQTSPVRSEDLRCLLPRWPAGGGE